MSPTTVEANPNGHDEEHADLATMATIWLVVSATKRFPEESTATPPGASSLADVASALYKHPAGVCVEHTAPVPATA